MLQIMSVRLKLITKCVSGTEGDQADVVGGEANCPEQNAKAEHYEGLLHHNLSPSCLILSQVK